MGNTQGSEKSVKDLLKCPICLKVPRHGPIYQCWQGHIFCSNCSYRLTRCYQCEASLSANIKNLVAEEMLEKIPMDCRYKESGCDVELVRNELFCHEEDDCLYRDVQCPQHECQNMVPLCKLVDHADTFHNPYCNQTFIDSDELSYHRMEASDYVFKGPYEWPCIRIIYDQKYFFCKQNRTKEGVWFIWVYMLEDGKMGRLEDYSCTLSITYGEGSERERKLSSTFTPASLKWSINTVEIMGQGLNFTDTIARSFIRYNYDSHLKKTLVTINFALNIQKRIENKNNLKRKMY